MTAAEISQYCQTVGNGVWFQNLAKACGGGEQGKKFVEGFLADYARAYDNNATDFNDKQHVFNIFRKQCESEYAKNQGNKTSQSKTKFGNGSKQQISKATSLASQQDISKQVVIAITNDLENGNYNCIKHYE